MPVAVAEAKSGQDLDRITDIYGKSAGPRRPITPYQKKGPSRPTGTSKGGACGGSWGAHNIAITLEVMRIVLAMSLLVWNYPSRTWRNMQRVCWRWSFRLAIGWVIVAGMYPRSFIILIFFNDG